MAVYANYTLHITEDNFYIQPYSQSGNTDVLTISRTQNTCSFTNENSIPPSQVQKPIFGIVGTIKLIAGNFLIVITSKSRVGFLDEHEIFKMDQCELFPYFKSDNHLNENEKKFDIMYKNMVENFLKTQNFYFSYTYDMSHTLQRLTETSPEFLSLPLHERADKRFIWNYRLLKALNTPQELDNFLLPIVLGFVEIVHAEINGKKFDFSLISRRSCNFAGTRFNVRGADNEGNVANFVETEQIVAHADFKCSFVQVRGSIPIIWTQKPNLKYKPSINIDDTKDQLDVCEKHFNRLVTMYSQQVCVNLVNQHGSEGKLEKSFADTIKKMDNPLIKYESFDFHKQCGTDRWDRLSILTNRLASDMDAFGFFFSTKTGNILGIQRGIFRVNCIDCLDRTNVVQGLLARRMLHIQLIKLNILGENEAIEAHEKFFNVFRNVWADNGDILSIQYAGTGALKSDFTRSGKRTTYGLMRDGVNSLQRYILNNFYDGFRQDSIDLFLGNHTKIVEAEPERQVDLVKCAAAFESDKKYLAIPVIGLGTFSMFIISLLIPAESFQEQLSYVFFWGVATICTLGVMIYFGKEIVDTPKLVHHRKNKRE